MILMANVECHFQIVKDHTTTKGGGYWEYDREKSIVWLYGSSIDYGRADKELLRELIKNEAYGLSFDGCKFMHSFSSKFEDVLLDAEPLN